jgi:ferredoxin-NADP reductase
MPVVQRIHCRVYGIRDHGHHVYTIDLMPERRVPRFRPGQFLHLSLDEYDPSGFWPESRVFSIASPPTERDRLRISYSVRGRFTARMERELDPGRMVWIKMPYGEFVVDGRRDVVLLAGGTGITAFTAFLGSLTPECQHDVYLFYGARRRSLLIYGSTVERVARVVPRLRPIYFVEDDSDADGSTLEVSTGCLSVAAAWRIVENPLEADYYLSGPPLMLKRFSMELSQHRLPTEAIHIDAWE